MTQVRHNKVAKKTLVLLFFYILTNQHVLHFYFFLIKWLFITKKELFITYWIWNWNIMTSVKTKSSHYDYYYNDNVCTFTIYIFSSFFKIIIRKNVMTVLVFVYCLPSVYLKMKMRALEIFTFSFLKPKSEKFPSADSIAC